MINIFQFRNGLRLIPVSSTGVSAKGELEVLDSSGKLVYHNGTTASPQVTEAHAATLTNKTIDADLNTLSNIDNADIKALAGIDATKIHDGSVSNTEFGYLDGVTSPIQTQINGVSGSAITALTGDVTATGPGSVAATIALNAVTNTKLADMATQTFKGRTTAGTGDPEDLTATQATAILNVFVGDSGSGGTKGLVPAPASGDAAALKFLKADGTWSTVPSGSGTVTETGTQTLTNKSLVDNSTFFIDDGDATKRMQFQVSGITTGTTRTLTVPNANTTIVGDDTTQTLTNKSLETSNVKFVQTSGTRLLNFDLSSQSSATQLTLASLLSTSKTVFFPDHSSNYTVVGDTNSQTLTNKDLNGGTASSQNKWALPKATKSTLDGLTRREANIFYATDQAKAYIDNGTTLLPVGSGSGTGGVNFVGLNTAFQFINSDDVDAENSVGNWAAYADAAGVAPVDMTGGSPNVTIARTTTSGEILNGSASFEVTKDAANRQGQGVSVIANIPEGYRGKPATITMPIKIISGSLVSGDLKVYIYDVTNAQVITPFNNDVVYTSTLRMTWDVPSNCTQIRVGFHFASTSTSAVNFSFDDIFVGPQDVSFGPAMSDWLSYTPTFTGFGTTTEVNFSYRRVGDTLEIHGRFKIGTPTAVAGKISLPPGSSINFTKSGGTGNHQSFGEYNELSTGGAVNNYGSSSGRIFTDGSDADELFFARQTASNALTKANGDTFGANSYVIVHNVFVPIEGWSTGVVTSNSSVFRIADILANGTRVTGSAPTLLGQYRSYLRNASAFTFTETNGSPGTAPSSANGILLYGGNAFSSADTNNEPSRYEIFVGKNKYLKTEFYLNTGRTGYVNTDCFQYSGGRDVGVKVDYDPTTGIVNVQTFRYVGGDTVNAVGTDSANAEVQDCYFDIIVSENAQAVQQASIRSEVTVHTGNGHGSVGTNVRRWSTVMTNNGTAITYADSATNGGSFTINEDGIYNITCSEVASAGTPVYGASRNSTDLTVQITSLDAEQNLAWSGVNNNAFGGNVSWTGFLRRGDIIRNQTSTGGNTVQDGQNYTKFHICKVNN